MKFYSDQIWTLQIDLVSACNARCPSCYRQDIVGRPQQHFPKNVHLDLSLYEKALRDPALKNLKEVFLCGNYGDAMASSQILELIDITDRVNPQLGIYLHTNGSLGKKSTWTQLAHRLNGRGRFVKFAIDGLEDTNSIYRRGVSWNTVMENARHFISEGGRAVWKYVVFEHNKHQIEEARQLAEKMGFVRFEPIKNYSPEAEPYYREEDMEKEPRHSIRDPDFVPEDRMTSDEIKRVQINCWAKEERSIFLDFEGSIWPCCWIPGWKYSSNEFFKKWHIEHFLRVSGGDLEFNSLKKFSLSEILKSPWFSKGLEESWDTSKESTCKRHSICLSKCGSVK